jgi:hypothetical protein
VRLRDAHARNVRLGYHMSMWGTGQDIIYSNPSDATVDQLGARAANFYNSLRANFDVIFGDTSDRDAAFKQAHYGMGPEAWWDANDYARHVRFLTQVTSGTGKRIVLWQIPFGNTKMRAVNNTWNHYQDNQVEWFLDDPSRAHLHAYIQAGVIALLFGRGADGVTCNCDANGDGVTNPAPINGNDLLSFNSDDDGGFFDQKSSLYYLTGAVPLLGGSSAPTPSPSATSTARTPTSTPTRVPSATPTPVPSSTPAASWTTSAAVLRGSLRRGQTIQVNAFLKSSSSASVLVDVEIYAPNGTKVHQQFWDNQSFTAGTTRTYSFSWRVPSTAARGTYTVKTGVFAPDWSSLHHWNNAAATFTVR